MMQSSSTRPKPNKLPPSQLIGFVKRHKAPPVSVMSKSESLPKIPLSPNQCSSDKNVNAGHTTANSSTRLWQTSPSSPTKTPHTVPAPLGKAIATQGRLPELKMKSVTEAKPMAREFPEGGARLPQQEVHTEEPAVLVSEAMQVREVYYPPVIKEVKCAAVSVWDYEEAVAVEESVSAAMPEREVLHVVHKVKEDACMAVAALDGISDHETISLTSHKLMEELAESQDGQSKPKVEKSPEEWEKEAGLKVQKCLHLMRQTPTIPVKSSARPLYLKEFMSHLKQVRLTYHSFRGMPLPLLMSCRLEVAHGLLSSGTVQVLCDTVGDVESSGLMFSEDVAVMKNYRLVAWSAMMTLMNYSDCSDDITYFLRDHPTCLRVVLKWLQEWLDPHLAKELQAKLEVILKMCLSVVHNTAMREDNIQCLRDLRANDILFPYLESHNDFYKLSAFASLADIVSEEEADKLSTSPDLARFLLRQLEHALKSKDHRCYGWSVVELVRAVRRLARNDANKRLLVAQGALPLLSQGIKSTFQDEKMGCMEALWVLSFDQQNVKEIMKDEELLDHIVEMSKDFSQPPALRHSAGGILWQCRLEMADSKKYYNISKDMSEKTRKKRQKKGQKKKPQISTPADDSTVTKATTTTTTTAEETEQMEEDMKEEVDQARHIMLSYQWADQELVKRIRDVLRAKGYRVWMDIDNMGGSTLQAMAAAIEDSSVVLTCMSQKYKDSPNCRAEAEYAFQQRKTIIPLITQRGYRPDGWLGMILGAKLFYDFSGKYSFESRIDGLLKAVADATGKVKGEEVTDGGHTQPKGEASESHVEKRPEKPTTAAFIDGLTAAPVAAPAPTPVRAVNGDKIKSWAGSDVKRWLTKFGLNGTELERLTGKEIAFLHSLRTQAPEFFYKTLDKKLHITTLSGLISFTDALDDLPAT